MPRWAVWYKTRALTHLTGELNGQMTPIRSRASVKDIKARPELTRRCLRRQNKSSDPTQDYLSRSCGKILSPSQEPQPFDFLVGKNGRKEGERKGETRKKTMKTTVPADAFSYVFIKEERCRSLSTSPMTQV